MAPEAREAQEVRPEMGDPPDAGDERDAGSDPQPDASAPDAGGQPDGGGGGDYRIDDYVGIYAIASVTHNSMSCDVEGPLAAEQPGEPTHFIAFDDTGRLVALACSNAEDCRASAEQWLTTRTSFAPWLYPVSGADLPPAGDLYGRSENSDALCTQETMSHATGTGEPGVSLRLEVEIVNVPAHERDFAGECSIEASMAAAAGIDCTELRVIRGTYQEPN